ncbi:MAG: glycosyl transferase [Candidatus Levybacteria bacterium RBG_16_35_11]|nr:MAG: glycosyl transferase [Candidatus Levybacteria bacterium RBG_16_35_11]
MISIIVPVFNEEESLPHFYKELKKNVSKLDKNYEIVFVDDGSTDSSLNIIKALEGQDKNVKIVRFRKNQGKAEALTLGFEKAEGDFIITLDADLQDRPDEVGKLLKKVKSGRFDMVTGWRRSRQDNFLRKMPSRLFNLLVFIFRGLKLHDYNSGLKVYTKEAAKSLNLYGGMHRFIPILLDMNGFKVGEIPVIHSKRKYGKAKYGLSRLWNDYPDMFTMLFLSRYSKRPMHFFGPIGGILLTTGIVILIYLSVLRFYGETIGNRPLLIFGVLMVITGLQIFFTGFLADLIIHVTRKEINGSNINNK